MPPPGLRPLGATQGPSVPSGAPTGGPPGLRPLGPKPTGTAALPDALTAPVREFRTSPLSGHYRDLYPGEWTGPDDAWTRFLQQGGRPEEAGLSQAVQPGVGGGAKTALRIAGQLAGNTLGAGAGLLTGPFAPVAVPALSALGGTLAGGGTEAGIQQLEASTGGDTEFTTPGEAFSTGAKEAALGELTGGALGVLSKGSGLAARAGARGLGAGERTAAAVGQGAGLLAEAGVLGGMAAAAPGDLTPEQIAATAALPVGSRALGGAARLAGRGLEKLGSIDLGGGIPGLSAGLGGGEITAPTEPYIRTEKVPGVTKQKIFLKTQRAENKLPPPEDEIVDIPPLQAAIVAAGEGKARRFMRGIPDRLTKETGPLPEPPPPDIPPDIQAKVARGESRSRQFMRNVPDRLTKDTGPSTPLEPESRFVEATPPKFKRFEEYTPEQLVELSKRGLAPFKEFDPATRMKPKETGAHMEDPSEAYRKAGVPAARAKYDEAREGIRRLERPKSVGEEIRERPYPPIFGGAPSEPPAFTVRHTEKGGREWTVAQIEPREAGHGRKEGHWATYSREPGGQWEMDPETAVQPSEGKAMAAMARRVGLPETGIKGPPSPEPLDLLQEGKTAENRAMKTVPERFLDYQWKTPKLSGDPEVSLETREPDIFLRAEELQKLTGKKVTVPPEGGLVEFGPPKSAPKKAASEFKPKKVAYKIKVTDEGGANPRKFTVEGKGANGLAVRLQDDEYVIDHVNSGVVISRIPKRHGVKAAEEVMRQLAESHDWNTYKGMPSPDEIPPDLVGISLFARAHGMAPSDAADLARAKEMGAEYMAKRGKPSSEAPAAVKPEGPKTAAIKEKAAKRKKRVGPFTVPGEEKPQSSEALRDQVRTLYDRAAKLDDAGDRVGAAEARSVVLDLERQLNHRLAEEARSAPPPAAEAPKPEAPAAPETPKPDRPIAAGLVVPKNLAEGLDLVNRTARELQEKYRDLEGRGLWQYDELANLATWSLPFKNADEVRFQLKNLRLAEERLQNIRDLGEEPAARPRSARAEDLQTLAHRAQAERIAESEAHAAGRHREAHRLQESAEEMEAELKAAGGKTIPEQVAPYVQSGKDAEAIRKAEEARAAAEKRFNEAPEGPGKRAQGAPLPGYATAEEMAAIEEAGPAEAKARRAEQAAAKERVKAKRAKRVKLSEAPPAEPPKPPEGTYELPPEEGPREIKIRRLRGDNPSLEKEAILAARANRRSKELGDFLGLPSKPAAGERLGAEPIEPGEEQYTEAHRESLRHARTMRRAGAKQAIPGHEVRPVNDPEEVRQQVESWGVGVVRVKFPRSRTETDPVRWRDMYGTRKPPEDYEFTEPPGSREATKETHKLITIWETDAKGNYLRDDAGAYKVRTIQYTKPVTLEGPGGKRIQYVPREAPAAKASREATEAQAAADVARPAPEAPAPREIPQGISPEEMRDLVDAANEAYPVFRDENGNDLNEGRRERMISRAVAASTSDLASRRAAKARRVALGEFGNLPDVANPLERQGSVKGFRALGPKAAPLKGRPEPRRPRLRVEEPGQPPSLRKPAEPIRSQPPPEPRQRPSARQLVEEAAQYGAEVPKVARKPAEPLRTAETAYKRREGLGLSEAERKRVRLEDRRSDAATRATPERTARGAPAGRLDAGPMEGAALRVTRKAIRLGAAGAKNLGALLGLPGTLLQHWAGRAALMPVQKALGRAGTLATLASGSKRATAAGRSLTQIAADPNLPQQLRRAAMKAQTLESATRRIAARLLSVWAEAAEERRARDEEIEAAHAGAR